MPDGQPAPGRRQARQHRRAALARAGHEGFKLTMLYAGLFALTLLLIFAAVYVAVSRNAERQVRAELVASGAVFERILALRTVELQNAAGLLARDFGFREAVATGDAATTASALENLRGRLEIDVALVVGVDGTLTASDGAVLAPIDPSVLGAIQAADDAVAGSLTIGGLTYFGVSAPVQAPTLAGWVVFASKVDSQALAELEGLSAIPLRSAVLVMDAAGRPRSKVGAVSRTEQAAPEWWSRALGADDVAVIEGSATLARPLRTLGGEDRAVLLLRYPIDAALSEYRALFELVFALAAAGLGLMLLGSWALARRITGPIKLLENAARALRGGETVSVDVAGADEVASLGRSFNAMAAGIRERERALETARDAAVEANRAKDVILANMSHELRTPLNGVLGLAGVLGATTLDRRQREMLGLMETSALDLQRVLGNVMDLASLESGDAGLAEADFDLVAAVRSVADEAERLALAKGLAFRLDLRLPEPTFVLGDEARVRQVVAALLANAVKFTATGHVGVTADVALEGGYRLEVRDTGVGFDPAQTERLFKPFSQADDSSTRRYGGAGVGLSLARGLARAMGGQITAHGAPGRGAVFTLNLPLRQAVAVPSVAAAYAEPDDAEGAEDAADNKPLRVLVADDHETNRTVVRLIMDAVGVEVVSVENGAEALAAFQVQDFDAVLMDIQMPVMDGLAAIRGIRRHEATGHARATPILVLSANALPVHRAASLAAGADDHVNKPVTAPLLLAALERALSQSERLAA